MSADDTKPQHPFSEELRLRVSSGYPLIYVVTHEEERARRLIRAALQSPERGVREWSISGGAGGAGAAEEPARKLPPPNRRPERSIFSAPT